ncbi:MAG: hypothetical protein JW809_20290 [Pirellulales bacterium]|nr:hypothetical protein [Pirellulales bacterium]
MRWIAALLVLGSVGIVRGGEPPRTVGRGNALPQILLHVKVLDIDEGKLRRADVDGPQARETQGPAGTKTGDDAEQAPAVRSDARLKGLAEALRQPGHARDALLEKLRRDGLVRVLAEPTLVTVVGRPASLRVGGEALFEDVGPDGKPVKKCEPYGTSVDVVPELTGEGNIRLQLKCEVSELDPARSVLAGGKERPAIRRLNLASVLEMKPAETAVLVGPSQIVDDEPSGPRTRAVLFLVTPEIIHPATAAR